MTLLELKDVITVVRTEFLRHKNTALRIGTAMDNIVDFFVDDKLSVSEQILEPEQQAQVRTNIKAPKFDTLTIADFAELDAVNIEDGYYKVISSTESEIDGFLLIGIKYVDEVVYSVMQIFISNTEVKGRNIVIATPQTYPLWEDIGGGGGGESDYEPTANKQDSLATDGTGVKFPTIDAVNAGLAEKIDTAITATASAMGDETYALELNKQTVLTGTLPNGVNSTFTLPSPVSGKVNESVVHFASNATAAPTLVYSGFTPVWLGGTAISMVISKNYTIVFEQIYNGSAWIVKASWGEY